MSKKNEMRKQLEAGMTLFLSEGKVITKLPTYGKKRAPKPKEETVEIDTDFLPVALRNKYFKD